MYVVAVTMEITFTLVENAKKISLFTKKYVEVLVLRQQQVTFTKMLLSVNLSIIFLHNYKVDK